MNEDIKKNNDTEFLKNCICCGKFVKKHQWVKKELCTEFSKDDCGCLCYECIGNIEHTSRD